MAKLAAFDWRGAITGPHGSGKSTLLETLQPALIAAGRRITFISLHNDQHWLPNDWRHKIVTASKKKPLAESGTTSDANNRLIIVDGYEQLAWFERVRLWSCCHRHKFGLLITSHMPVRLPTLIRLTPNRHLVEQLIEHLCMRVSTDITLADVAASHDCHGSNVREILFDLYDCHERRRRESNSLPAAS
ncbi:MAG TPA: hypothetical protein VFW73_02070 [Lacipirellulaceae bacterium]|nr:hypothetical protein [Lacipirellulaceae bacterium]